MNLGQLAAKRLQTSLASAKPFNPSKFGNPEVVENRLRKALEVAATSQLSPVVEQPTTIFSNRKMWVVRTQNPFDTKRWNNNFYFNKAAAFEAYRELKKVFTVSRVMKPRLVTIKEMKFPKS